MIKSIIRKFIPESVISVYHYVLARFAAAIYKHPSKDMIVIGVTGTNGKSTTVQFIGKMLEHMGERVGWTSTAGFKIADKEWVNDKKMTMLGRFQTHRMLCQMRDAGCRFAIIETSSQGLIQSRHIGVQYDAAVFTNLTPEHIEAHGGFEKYKQAKERLFAALGKHKIKRINEQDIESVFVVNTDDSHAESFLSYKADNKFGFGINDLGEQRIPLLSSAPVIPTSVEFSVACTTFTLADSTFHFKPAGRFNLMNVLAAIATVRAFGKEWNEIQDAVEDLESVPGRFELIDEGQPFKVIVDYAYEPAALTALYEAIELIPHNRIIHVVGSAGGGRDVARRAVLGALAAEHDDIIIVANEDPYDEDPMQIINDVANAAAETGKQDGVNLFRILDRQEAINKAVKIAQSDDIVIITGKGSEPVMALKHGKKEPWDDRKAARQAIRLQS